MSVDVAMILAAGYGKRMMPLTMRQPKPLIDVAGKTMLDRALDHTAQFNIRDVVVNCHYLSPLIQKHLEHRPHTKVLYEADILETGGGIKNALPYLGEKPFAVLNGDVVWFGSETLMHMAQEWNDDMDAMLMLVPIDRAEGYQHKGDFFLDEQQNLIRRGNHDEAPYVFGGVQILHPRLFEGAPEGAFSINALWDKAIEEDRIKGFVHTGPWFHIGTPGDVTRYEERIQTLDSQETDYAREA